MKRYSTCSVQWSWILRIIYMPRKCKYVLTIRRAVRLIGYTQAPSVSFIIDPHLRIDEEGNRYEGFMKYGVRSGAGKLVYSENNEHLESFDGEWADDMKKNGLLTYREYLNRGISSDSFSGSQYHGDISNDERHGQGILYFPTGAWYEGTWKHNEMDGDQGRYYFENVRS